MSDQICIDGFEPSEEEKAEARQILDSGLASYLGIGQENAVTTKQLAERLFTNGRSITLAVYDARRAGVPICSGVSGFYLPRSERDVISCVNGMAGRAREIVDSARAVWLGWASGWRPPEGGTSDADT